LERIREMGDEKGKEKESVKQKTTEEELRGQ
jgi:hypothetical protein